MNEEPTREEVVEFLTRGIMYGLNYDDIQMFTKAIEYIQQVPKYRNKAKRWKRKYMSLRSKVERIRAEIAEDMANAGKEAKQTQDDVDLGKGIGLQMALDVINKYTTERNDKE